MRCFCYFVEPASYTLDLAKNIYDKNKIDYCFIYSTTMAKSEGTTNKILLDQFSFFLKLKFLYNTYKNHDLIIINGYNNYVFLLTFIMNFLSFRKKFIAIESDSQLLVPDNFLKKFIKFLYLSVVFQNSYTLGFAGGSSSHKDLFRHYGMQEDRIFLMPMMVDNKKFYQKNKIFPKLFTFLYVGRLVQEKNVENLIKQFITNFSGKRAVLKIIGDGAEESYLKKKYMSNNVLFLGSLFDDNLVNEFKDASCFVLPSLFEPWGLVVNEALSAGLPVISAKEVGACHDLLRDGKSGIITSDMNDFSCTMLRLYNNPDLLVEFSRNALHTMKNTWNYDLYDRCLNHVVKKVQKWG